MDAEESQAFGDKLIRIFGQKYPYVPSVVEKLRKDAGGHIGLWCEIIVNIMTDKAFTQKVQKFNNDTVMSFYLGRLMYRPELQDRLGIGYPEEQKHSKRLVKLSDAEEEKQRAEIPRVLEDMVTQGRVRVSSEMYRILSRSNVAILADGSDAPFSDSPEGTWVEFPSHIHELVCAHLLFPENILPAKMPADIDMWLMTVLQKFSSKQLRDRSMWGKGARPYPKERGVLQGEFYRSGVKSIPSGVQFSYECGQLPWLAGSEIRGSLDFYVNKDLKWAIELMRQGDRMSKHIDRLSEGGTYDALQPNVARVVDFRQDLPREWPSDVYVAVVLDKNMSSANVYRMVKGSLAKTRVVFGY